MTTFGLATRFEESKMPGQWVSRRAFAIAASSSVAGGVLAVDSNDASAAENEYNSCELFVLSAD